MYKEKSVVISMVKDTKVAALCADYALPGAYMALDEKIEQDLVMGSFLPPRYCADGRTCATLQSHLLSVGRTGYCLGDPFRNSRQEGEAWIKLMLGFGKPLGDSLRGIIGSSDQLDYGVLLKFEDHVVSCKLTGLDLVDVDKTSWAHILDFRNDAESLRHVIRLREFLDEDLASLRGEEVAEHLYRLLDNYGNALKKWNFPMRKGSVECILPLGSYPSFEEDFVQPVFNAPLARCFSETQTARLGNFTLSLNKCAQRNICFHEFGHTIYVLE